jgi:cytosine/adenosine deaminase-related metal-dependent hydrolase
VAIDGSTSAADGEQGLTPDETYRLAASGAVAGLCPTTEVNLGDGIFRASVYLANGGIYGVGTDSNIQIDAAVELRQLEYSQRLNYRSRNVLARYEGESTGHSLYTAALTGGAQALSQPIGAIEPNRRADIVVLDADQSRSWSWLGALARLVFVRWRQASNRRCDCWWRNCGSERPASAT